MNLYLLLIKKLKDYFAYVMATYECMHHAYALICVMSLVPW